MGRNATDVAAGGPRGFAPALTSFVGRAAEVGEVTELLERHRLVTVTGPGGVGKTRLASEVAQRMAARFEDGAWLVELTAVHVCLLATSREPIAVPGEARYRLPPLQVPEAGGQFDPAAPALALFTDRARRSDHRFGLDGDTGQLARRLVARLDGMPLAIELAAARVEAWDSASWWTGSRTASGC